MLSLSFEAIGGTAWAIRAPCRGGVLPRAAKGRSQTRPRNPPSADAAVSSPGFLDRDWSPSLHPPPRRHEPPAATAAHSAESMQCPVQSCGGLGSAALASVMTGSAPRAPPFWMSLFSLEWHWPVAGSAAQSPVSLQGYLSVEDESSESLPALFQALPSQAPALPSHRRMLRQGKLAELPRSRHDQLSPQRRLPLSTQVRPPSSVALRLLQDRW